jgi:hypothetical protein
VGETQKEPFQLSFNGRLKVDFQGARVTSDGGLLMVRELDERLGFGELIERHLTEVSGKNTQLFIAARPSSPSGFCRKSITPSPTSALPKS